MSGTTEESAGARAIRPFTIEIPEAEIEALRARIAATRWPEKETVADQSQGVQLETVRELARYLGDGLQLAHVRGEAEHATALHHRDRWA